MKRISIIFTITVALLSMSAQATNVTSDVPEQASAIDSIDAVIDEAPQGTIIADTVTVNVADTVSTADVSAQLMNRAACCFLETPNSYREYQGPDFHFLKNTTNPAAKPYTFLQDQTWVGIPLFVSGMIAKGEKEAFRQNYNNPNTKIRLIKYNLFIHKISS